MAVRNIARGGGKNYKVEVTGLKELERKLKALSVDNPQLKSDIFGVVGDAADELRDEMRSAARAAGWESQTIHFAKPGKKSRIFSTVVKGSDAIASIFAYAKPRGGDFRKRISAIAGVSKQATLGAWRAGAHPKSPDAKVAPGGMVDESLGSMLEFGTSRMKARPAIRAVIRGNKSRMIEMLTKGYNSLLLKYSK